MICPCCGGRTDQQDGDGHPLICNPCKEAELGQEVLENTVQQISQLSADPVEGEVKKRWLFGIL